MADAVEQRCEWWSSRICQSRSGAGISSMPIRAWKKLVERNIAERIARSDMQSKFGRILVPSEEVVEMRNGARRTTERRLFPGYVFVEMVMDDDTFGTWSSNTSKV